MYPHIRHINVIACGMYSVIRKRIYTSMMLNTASPTAVDDVKKVENDIEMMRERIKSRAAAAANAATTQAQVVSS